MTIFLNGDFVEEPMARLSIFDRGFLYGDGLFETLPVFNGIPFRWNQHWERLRRGAEFLGIELRFHAEVMRGLAAQLLERNGMKDAILRINLSRGVGGRGYSVQGASQPTLLMTLHPAQDTICGCLPPLRLVISSVRLPTGDPLAGFKTCNKLPQVLARAEADSAGADEALLWDANGHVVEGSAGNLFWFERDTLFTAPAASGILPGVTRDLVLEICRSLGLASEERAATPEALREADGVFLSNSVCGLVEAGALDRKTLASSPWFERLRNAYLQVRLTETGPGAVSPPARA